MRGGLAATQPCSTRYFPEAIPGGKVMIKISLMLVGAFALATSIAACGDQGYGPTHSYSARVGSNGTAADATANNGSTSSSYEAQRQKVDNYNGDQPGYR
jgi:hypothetical protein